MSSTTGGSRGTAHDEVVEEHRLSKGFTFRSAFALAFADISPIVALYAIFTLALFSAGPAFFWAFPIVLIGQLLVAAVFGELASRWHTQAVCINGRATSKAHNGAGSRLGHTCGA